jgi:hypothetical protein
MSKEIVDQKIQPEFVRDKLLDIFIKNKKDGDHYTAVITDLFGETIIDIQNNGVTCQFLDIPIEENGKFIISIGLINKCDVTKGSGTKSLTNIIEFGVTYDYDLVKLNNISELLFTFDDGANIDMNLTMIKILEIGNTWYSQYGFNNTYTKRAEPEIKSIIRKSFDNLLIEYDEYVDRLQIDENKKNKIKEEFLKNVDGYLFQLNKDGIEITMSENICDFVKRTMKHIYKICMHGNCPSNFNNVLRRIYAFILFLNSIVFTILFKKYVNEASVKKIISYYYSSLELNLKEVSFTKGGKSRTARRRLRKSGTARRRVRKSRTARK